MEAELKANYPNSNVTLIRGRDGIFDVKCEGKLVYSKQNIAGNRFPIEGEITTLIKKGMPS